DILLQQRLSEDAATWQRRGHLVDNLYRGLVLDEALAWVDRNAPSAGELAVLTAALDERHRQEAEERARQARQLELARQSALANRRAAQRLRYFAAVLVVSLVLVAGLSGIALKSAAIATTNAHREAQARATAVA